MTSIVLFDLGNVVAAWDPAPRIAAYAERSGLSEAEVRERLSTDGFWASTDRGGVSSEEMVTGICRLLSCEFTYAELLRLQASAFTVRSEVLAIARTTAASCPVGILTNNAPLLEDAFPTYFPELLDLFDPVLFSYEFGCQKPERRLFEQVERRLGLAGTEIAFVDDSERNVRAAAALGWDGIHYATPEALRQALTARGVLGPGSSTW